MRGIVGIVAIVLFEVLNRIWEQAVRWPIVVSTLVLEEFGHGLFVLPEGEGREPFSLRVVVSAGVEDVSTGVDADLRKTFGQGCPLVCDLVVVGPIVEVR